MTVSREGAGDCPAAPEQALSSPDSPLAETCPGSEVSWWFFVLVCLFVCQEEEEEEEDDNIGETLSG